MQSQTIRPFWYKAMSTPSTPWQSSMFVGSHVVPFLSLKSSTFPSECVALSITAIYPARSANYRVGILALPAISIILSQRMLQLKPTLSSVTPVYRTSLEWVVAHELQQLWVPPESSVPPIFVWHWQVLSTSPRANVLNSQKKLAI